MEGYRLAPQQRRLWALGNGPAYRSCCTIVIEGDLDRSRLRSAAEEVAARHEALRTCFRRWPGLKLPLQVVHGAMAIAWREVEGDGWEPQQLRGLRHELRRAPIDLSAGPLVHATLIRLHAQKHCLELVLPALAADAVSLGNLFRSIVEAYGAGPGRGPAAEEEVQFLQVSEWLNELAEDEDSAAGREFWRRELAGISPLSLPYELRAAGEAEFLPAVEALELEAAEEILKERAGQLGTSLETLLLAAWASLLWKLTGGSEIVVDKVFNGRTLEDLATVCGLVATTLPLRLHLEAGFRFQEVLRRLEGQAESAWRWQAYCPFPEELRAGCEGSFAFELVDWPPPARAAGVSFSLNDPDHCIDRFKAKLVCGRVANRLRVDLHYDPASLDPTAARCLLRQLRELLADASANPETSLVKLRLSSPEELRRWAVDGNRTVGVEIPEACVHSLFERQVLSSPDNLAVVCEDRGLTYRELDDRANLLARHLRRMGVGAEVPVALCVERSVEMVIGLLAVLKAGGFYVPLDPASPRQRLSLMLEEVGASVLLTQRALLDRLPEEAGRILLLDGDERRWKGAWRPPPGRSPRNWPTCSSPPGRPDVPRVWPSSTGNW